MGTARAPEAAWTCPARVRARSRAQIPFQDSGTLRTQLGSGQRWAKSSGGSSLGSRTPGDPGSTLIPPPRGSRETEPVWDCRAHLPPQTFSRQPPAELPGSCLKCRAGPLAGERVSESGGSGAQQMPWVTSLIGQLSDTNPHSAAPQMEGIKQAQPGIHTMIL